MNILVSPALGQPIAGAEIRLTLVGGMAGRLGEHDEDSSVTLAAAGSSR